MAKLTVTIEVDLKDLSDANGVIFSLRQGYGFPNRDVARDVKVTGYSVEWSDGEEGDGE